MATLTRSVHAAKVAASMSGGVTAASPRTSQETRSLTSGDASKLTGRVVEIMGEHSAAVELERAGGGQFLEEIVVHGHPGWNRGLTVGQRVHATGEWELADWRAWDIAERSHYLAIQDRLEFRVATLSAETPSGSKAA